MSDNLINLIAILRPSVRVCVRVCMSVCGVRNWTQKHVTLEMLLRRKWVSAHHRPMSQVNFCEIIESNEYRSQLKNGWNDPF